MSKVSVIMSVYNEKEDWLKKSIESILNQTYSNIEFIIVLDNPKNLVLKKVIESYVKKDNRIKFLINEKNKGLIFSLNRALKYCKGEYIARMDADDISHKDRLERQLFYLKENNLDLIGANVNLFNEEGVFFTTAKLLTHKYLKKLLRYGTIGIVHPTFFAKKEVYEKLNGYSELALYAEDKDFVARAICYGFKIGNVKDILLDYRYSNLSVTKSNAFYVYKVGNYISKVFGDCINNKSYYELKREFLNNIFLDEYKKNNFNKSQILLGEALNNLNQKRYFKFLYKILKSFYYSPDFTFDKIKINLVFKILKFLEEKELKGKY